MSSFSHCHFVNPFLSTNSKFFSFSDFNKMSWDKKLAVEQLCRVHCLFTITSSKARTLLLRLVRFLSGLPVIKDICSALMSFNVTDWCVSCSCTLWIVFVRLKDEITCRICVFLQVWRRGEVCSGALGMCKVFSCAESPLKVGAEVWALKQGKKMNLLHQLSTPSTLQCCPLWSHCSLCEGSSWAIWLYKTMLCIMEVVNCQSLPCKSSSGGVNQSFNECFFRKHFQVYWLADSKHYQTVKQS